MSKHVKALREWADMTRQGFVQHNYELRDAADHLERVEKQLRIAKAEFRRCGCDGCMDLLAKMKAVK